MGYYIETPDRFGKAAYLAINHHAVLCTEVPDWSDEAAIICVVGNADFEAAAYCYSPEELAAFNRPGDPRPKLWLLMDKKDAQRLSGFAQS